LYFCMLCVFTVNSFYCPIQQLLGYPYDGGNKLFSVR
jgi:hypothetical protein